MTPRTETNEEGLDMRRRRLRFRAWHRGMREVDLLLGRFADAAIADLDEDDLAAFEALLLVRDPDILAWISGDADIPREADSPVLRRILLFHGTTPQPKQRQ